MFSRTHWYVCRYQGPNIHTTLLKFNVFMVSVLYSILESSVNSIFESGCLKRFFKYKIDHPDPSLHFPDEETEAQRVKQLAQVHTAESSPELGQRLHGQRPTSNLPGSQVFLGGSQARIQPALLWGHSAVRHAGVLWGTAASGSRSARHPPRASAGERAVSHCMRGWPWLGGGGWLGRQWLEWTKETHFLSIFRSSKHPSAVKLLRIKTFLFFVILFHSRRGEFQWSQCSFSCKSTLVLPGSLANGLRASGPPENLLTDFKRPRRSPRGSQHQSGFRSCSGC